MKIDPHKSQESYINWKEKTESRIPDLSPDNNEIIKRYLNDMELGLNVSRDSRKGPRSYARLLCLKNRIVFLARQFNKQFNVDPITDIIEEQVHRFINDMKTGKIRKQNGGIYLSTGDYVKDFKAFWNWHIKINAKQGKQIENITQDLDSYKPKPKWVYLTEQEVKKLAEKARYNYKILIYFLFDTGIRAPTELMNIRVSDIYNNYKELNIREEISKTFGRKIKLMISSNLLKDYIESENLQSQDYLFKNTPSVTNRYLKRLALRVFGDKTSLAGEKYSNLTMYDFRHVSCCYWLPRYKSESALKYRFGWKKSDKIHYYSELLGMKDTISEEDLLIDTTKTEIEQKLETSENEKEIMRERVAIMEQQMTKALELINQMELKLTA